MEGGHQHRREQQGDGDTWPRPLLAETHHHAEQGGAKDCAQEAEHESDEGDESDQDDPNADLAADDTREWRAHTSLRATSTGRPLTVSGMATSPPGPVDSVLVLGLLSLLHL